MLENLIKYVIRSTGVVLLRTIMTDRGLVSHVLQPCFVRVVAAAADLDFNHVVEQLNTHFRLVLIHL